MKKKIVLILIIVVILILISLVTFNAIKNNNIKKENELLLNEIKTNYSEYVIITNDTKLYKKENNEYKEYGKVSSGVKLTLDNIKVSLNTKYFLIKDTELYVNYKDIKPTDEYKNDDTYKNYIYFNSNIKTKEKTNFYNFEDNLIYTINDSFDFKIIVMDNNRYGIEYNNQLLFVHDEDVENKYDNENTTEASKKAVRTLTYHFIHDPEITYCNQAICHTFEQFESHLKYINENNYFSLRMIDMDLYMDGKINIPEKSIVLTIDDASIIDLGFIDLLEKYEVNATLFVITKLYEDVSTLRSDYLGLESHTENMHNQYECPGYGSQGGGILCLPEDYVLNDLKTSQNKVGSNLAFAYPFFDFSDRAISLLKKAGFKLAFIGQYDTDGYSYQLSTDKYKLRRKTIFSSTTMEEFVSYLK